MIFTVLYACRLPSEVLFYTCPWREQDAELLFL